ncbi:MAG: histidine kinase [Sphingobacteriales bacterium]|nr:histidine kinase [Sphingobacteriales bacterium]
MESEIEQRKKAKEETKIQFSENLRSKELLRVKDEFITMASHELRTPLTSLKGYLQIAMKTDFEDCSPKHLDIINKAGEQAEKLAQLVKVLFQTSRIQLGQFDLQESIFDLARLIRDIKEGYKVLGGNKVNYDGPEELLITADLEKIEQVIKSLVDNAFKYSSPKSEVNVRVDMNGSAVKVYIQDFGIGIQGDHLGNLFDRYYKVENTSQNFSGMGLGLYLSSQIIYSHKGAIGVESVFGEGSTFWFTLLLSPCND